jgi:predicted nucleic acid-binding protein
MPDTAPATLVVDSSVAVKWFLSETEPHVDRALTLLESHLAERVRLEAPDHLRLEVLSALLHRGLTPDEVQSVAVMLDGFRLSWHRTSAPLAASAADIASRHGLTFYDATFAALALELDAELVTADDRLASSGACRLWRLNE